MGSSGKRVWNSKELQSTKRKELASWGKDVRGKYLREVLESETKVLAGLDKEGERRKNQVAVGGKNKGQ